MPGIKASFPPKNRPALPSPPVIMLLACCLALAGLFLYVAEAAAAQRVLPASADAAVYAHAYRNGDQSNAGRHAQLAAGWHPTGGERRTYIRFNLPPITKVSKATLRLYVSGIYGRPGCCLAAFLVTTPWKKGTGANHSGRVEKTASPGEISWQRQPEVVARSGIEFSGGDRRGAWASVEITGFVNLWLRGKPNYGVAIMPMGPKSGESGYLFHSREYRDTSLRPQLILETSLASGDVSPRPPTAQPRKKPSLTGEEARKQKEAQRLRDEAALLEKRGKLEAALAKYEQSLRLQEHAQARNGIRRVRDRIQDLKRRAGGLKAQGKQQEARGELKQALVLYKQSLSLWPDPALERHAAQLKTRVQDQAKARDKAGRLYEQGRKHEEAGRFPQALTAYEQSASAWPLSKAKQGAVRLQKRKDLAARTAELGLAREKRGDYNGARNVYRQSLTQWPDPKVQARLDSLKKRKRRIKTASAFIDAKCAVKPGTIVVPPGMMATDLSGALDHGGLPCAGADIPQAWGGCIRGTAGLYYWFETRREPPGKKTLGVLRSLVLGPGAYTVCIWGGKPSHWDVRYTLSRGTGPFSPNISGPFCCGQASPPGK